MAVVKNQVCIGWQHEDFYLKERQLTFSGEKIVPGANWMSKFLVSGGITCYPPCWYIKYIIYIIHVQDIYIYIIHIQYIYIYIYIKWDIYFKTSYILVSSHSSKTQ